jgi:glycine cleavage system T protein
MIVQLESIERANGATFGHFAERALPARFGDVEDEWAAVRQRCGLLDAGFRGLLRLTGSDRTTFLQGMVSNDVAKLQAGQGTYAALLTQQGKVVSDLRIYVLADEMWLDVPAARTVAVRETLEKYIIADDVEFAADDAWAPLVTVEGPQAARTVLSVTGEAVEGLNAYAHREATFDGTGVRVVAASHAGETGYVLFGSPDAGARLWEHCRAAGAEPIGMEALDVLRVEAGIPWYGRDIDESTLISEAGLDAAVSYKKGCYLGQEVVERVAARGQVHRKLVGLQCDGRRLPAAGTKLRREDNEVGWITSAVWSPARASAIALGYVRREWWDVGTELQVILPEGSVSAHVAALPFYASRP